MSNPYRVIKQLAFLTGFCIVAGMSVRAQQSYYIFLQSENGQPFYAQIGDKVYSSSAIGHLILSGLKDNVCNFEIGFPQHTVRPQQFSVQVRGKDHGYQLKKTGAQEWALYSWQNQETVKSLRGSGNSALLYGERKKDDAFATLMAAVVNDSAVLYTSIVKNDAAEVPQNIAKTGGSSGQPAVEPAKEEKKTDVAAGSLTQAALDSTKPYRPEKPLFDTSSVAKVDKPLPDTASIAAKPKSEKPLYDTGTVTARIYKEDKPLYDTTVTTITPVYKNEKPLYDTSKVVAKQPKIEKKPGVVKVQETTNKDGETKLVFIDSSESPANVVTVYITEDKAPVQQKAPAQPALSDPLAAGTPKIESEPKTETAQKTDADKKDDNALKTQPAQKTDADKKNDNALKTQPVQKIDADKKDDNALKPQPAQKTDADKKDDNALKTQPAPKTDADKKDDNALKTQPAQKTDADKKDDNALKTETAAAPGNPAKAANTSPVKQDVVETGRTEMLKPVIGKPAAKKGDTLTIILESPQQKRDTNRAVKQEAPKPLYEPKQVTQPVAKTNTDNQPARPEATKAAGQPAITDNQSVKQDAAKQPANTDNQPAIPEASKAAGKPANTDTQRENPETGKKDTAIAKQETPKAVYNPNPRPADTDKKKIVMINSDCARFAGDNDIDKLRVKMLAENDVNKRVAIANKVFKTMCLYARQIKALSELFPTDETKYKFLEMAWPFAADTENFKELYQLFTAESFQTRFKTLVRY